MTHAERVKLHRAGKLRRDGRLDRCLISATHPIRDDIRRTRDEFVTVRGISREGRSVAGCVRGAISFLRMTSKSEAPTRW